MKPRLQEQFESQVVSALMEEFGYKNRHEVPRIEKVVVNMGVGEAVQDSKKVQAAAGDLTLGADGRGRLERALEPGRYRLDVFDPEPPMADDPLLTLDNVVLAPHSLGWTDQMFAEFGRLNAGAVLDVAAGRVPGNVVNGDVLDRPGFRARLAAFSGR